MKRTGIAHRRGLEESRPADQRRWCWKMMSVQALERLTTRKCGRLSVRSIQSTTDAFVVAAVVVVVVVVFVLLPVVVFVVASKLDSPGLSLLPLSTVAFLSVSVVFRLFLAVGCVVVVITNVVGRPFDRSSSPPRAGALCIFSCLCLGCVMSTNY